jgi:FHS family L-fucose permease-like MFS transporter
MFVPAATMEFSFLPYRFIYSRTWFSIQQIVANPLAIKMGSPDTGAHRLTLAGINSFGTTIGAILLGIALFGMGNDKTDLSLEDIKLPFIILGLLLL